MFKKITFACATLALVSAQSLTDLANQANAALAPVLGQENAVVQNGDALSLNVNDYEWTLTEVNGEYNLSVDQLAENANNLAPALSALLANVGSVAQANNGAIENVLDAEAASVGVDIENNGGLADVASQYGAQLSDNSAAVTDLATQQYTQAAAALAENTNGVTDQVNAQINEAVQSQESLSAAVSSAVNTAVDNAGSLNDLAASQAGNLPVSVTGNTDALINAASNVNANDAAATANNLAGQALNAGVDAANNNLGSDAANAVQGAASDAATSAATSLSSAAGSLNADSVNNLASAANLVNGQ